MKKHYLNFPSQTSDLTSNILGNSSLDMSTASIEELSAIIVEDMIEVVKKDLAAIKAESQE